MANVQSPPLVWLNGSPVSSRVPTLSAFDRGFLYGDGLFETMRAYTCPERGRRNGKVFRLRQHLQRLFNALPILDLTLPYTPGELADAVHSTLDANGLCDAVVRLTVTRGVTALVLDLAPPITPTVLITAREFHGYPPELYERGMSAVISPVRRNETSPLARLKSLNFMDSLLSRSEAQARGAEEAILLNTQGVVAEGSVSNLFIISGGKLITPDVDSGILPGITRAAVIRLARAAGLVVEERIVTLDELRQADEAFLTNSLMEVMPLTRIENAPVSDGRVGAVTTQLRQEYRRLLNESP